MNAKRTIVTFRSCAFNSKEQKDYFINAENFGDDLALWLSERFEKRNVRIQKGEDFPGQEDFGWFFNCKVDGDDYCVVIGHHYDNEDFEWIIWIERKCGLMKSLFGGRKKDIASRVPQTVHEILSSTSDITCIKWHRQADSDQGQLDQPASSP